MAQGRPHRTNRLEGRSEEFEDKSQPKRVELASERLQTLANDPDSRLGFSLQLAYPRSSKICMSASLWIVSAGTLSWTFPWGACTQLPHINGSYNAYKYKPTGPEHHVPRSSLQDDLEVQG